MASHQRIQIVQVGIIILQLLLIALSISCVVAEKSGLANFGIFYSLCESFLINLLTTILIILFSISAFMAVIKKFILRLKRMSSMGYAYDFWDVKSKCKPWKVIFGGTLLSNSCITEKSFDPDKVSPRPTMQSVYAYSEILNNVRSILNNDRVHVSFLSVREISPEKWHSLENENVVFIGGVKSIPGVIKDLLSQSNAKLTQVLEGNDRIIEIEEDTDYRIAGGGKLISKVKPPHVTKDHTIVLRNQRLEGSIFLFCGGFGIGTLSAVRAFSTQLPNVAVNEIKTVFENEKTTLSWVVSAQNCKGLTAGDEKNKISISNGVAQSADLASFYGGTAKYINDISKLEGNIYTKDGSPVIIFDLDDTIVDTFNTLIIPLEKKASQAIAAEIHRYPETVIENMLIKQRKNSPSKICDSIQTFYAEDGKKAVDIYKNTIKNFDISELNCSKKMFSMLHRTNTKFRTVLLTEGSERIQKEKIEHLHLAVYFDSIIIVPSGRKEDALRKIQNEFGVSPELCVVVGNRLDNEIRVARRLGMRMLWVEHGEGSEIDEPYCGLKCTFEELSEYDFMLLFCKNEGK